MMQTFRNNMKIVFYIIIVFFIGWMGITLTGLDDYLMQQNRTEVAGMKYAGSVDGQKIERTLYEQRVQNSVDMASNQRAGGSLSAWEIDQIADQVWNNLVNDIILGRIYDRRNIRVRDAEVVEYIKSNPLPELRSAPELQTDGRFDYDKYLNLLANPQAGNLVLELEKDAREKIPSLKLLVEVASLSKLTDAEIKQIYTEMNEQASVSYIRFSIDSLVSDSEVSVADEEVDKYYRDHLAGRNIRSKALKDTIDFSHTGWNHFVEKSRSINELITRFFALPRVVTVIKRGHKLGYKKIEKSDMTVEYWELRAVVDHVLVRAVICAVNNGNKFFLSCNWLGTREEEGLKIGRASCRERV